MEIGKKIKAKKQVKELVERFEKNIFQYKRANYGEANTRADFIDPFFESLGWDVANKQGYAEQYREVVREAKVIIAGKHKAPDYSFRIGGIRKFFVEAKRPSIDLKHEVSPTYQLRRYAYTAKLPLSILTDFDEFSVYDTRIKPTPKDSASCARIFYCGYKDYLKNFDFIYDTFSKEGILRGSFDRYIESTKNKRGTSEVDKEFLKLIDRWREKLAKNIALRNKSLTLYELNFAVQKIVDRIIFLRITEDRQIEDYGKLQILLNGTNTYRRLMEIFLHSDKKYNSGLFDFEKDEITPGLSVDDKVIKEILKSVYYPESPYEFSVLDVEILGNIYEQFLGKTIRLTPAHQVKVEEKPEVKKAGGVYYTPKYIVDYIVKNTVGEIIKSKTPRQIDKIKLLDPACGSGSFLLGAYQHLLNYHLNWYSKGENCKKALKKGQIIQPGKDSFQLTIAEKQRILLNNIFGVDIDTQAVEVSKLSLLLKLLEGETEESTRQLFRYTQMKLLPDLSNNIKCGNSLIGPDFYDAQQATLFDETEMRRINVFDWQSAFPDIFHNGGFNVVIGNPPWVSIKGKHKSVDLPEETLKFLFKKYKCDTYMPNMYELFVRRSLAILSKGGFFSFIVPDRLCANQQFITLRKYILENFSVKKLWFKASFPKVIADTVIFVFEKRKRTNNLVEVAEYPDDKFIKIPQTAFYETSDYAFFYVNNKIYNIFKKIRLNSSIIQLGQKVLTTSGCGAKSGKIEKEQGNNRQIQILKGESIQRYLIRNKFWFEFTDINLTGRTKDTRKLGKKFKVLLRKTGSDLIATFDDSGIYPEQSLYFAYTEKDEDKELLLFILALLNSKLMNCYYRNFAVTNRDSTPQLKKVDFDRFPISEIDFSNPSEKAMHDKLVTMVEKMLELQKKFHSVRLESDKKMYKTQIDVLDNQIDSLVYELYGLAEEEIRIVEKGTQK